MDACRRAKNRSYHLNFADKNNIDLIAIATHGSSGLGRTIFGSVADHVLRGAGLPVMVMKPK
jgi:nucleotide-binding universal stress UspA family protein